MVLGDSVTYGMGVDYQDSHPASLRHLLSLDPDYDWEVLNRSVPGWHGWNQLQYFKMKGIEWKPDIVTVNVVMNDFKPHSDEHWERAIKKPPGSYYLFEQFRFFNMIRVLIMSLKTDRADEFLNFPRTEIPEDEYGLYGKDVWWYIRGKYDTEEKENFYRNANELCYPRYKQLQQECDKIGAFYLVVIYPTSSQVSLQYWRNRLGKEILEARPIHEFCEWLDENDIPYINLLDAFRAETNFALFIDGSHLTKYGNRIAATEVINYLTQEGLLKLYGAPFWE
jgi:hypothetical protein